ncbi:MAG: hydroxymethylbilane synthase [Chloroflexota bacterium]
MSDLILNFGTRGSKLARQQTSLVAAALTATIPGLATNIVVMTTKGDRELSKPLPEIGGKGLFTAELEAALHNEDIDVAVHSLKDLPTENPPGLTIGAILPRSHPGDTLISRTGHTVYTLPQGAMVGTSSLRRVAQLKAIRPDLQTMSIRGNIDTRIAKGTAEDGPYDAIVLAQAGLLRLNLDENTHQVLPFTQMLPAPGQGAIAIQCRAQDTRTLGFLAHINHTETLQAVVAERAFLSSLNAGCSLPVAALGIIDRDILHLQGLVASLDGQQVIRVEKQGKPTDAQDVGEALAQTALDNGAQSILEAVNGITALR